MERLKHSLKKGQKGNLNKKLHEDIFRRVVKKIITLEQNINPNNVSHQQSFTPQAIVRYSQIAFQKAIVMKYLDNLIEWGDTLFRQTELESIHQAIILYEKAYEILGPKPINNIRSHEEHSVELTFEEKHKKYQILLEEIEKLIEVSDNNDKINISEEDNEIINSSIFYLCNTRDGDLFKYWDIIADRLSIIQHS